MRFNSTHDTCEGGDLSIPGGHCSSLYGTTTYRNTRTLYLRMPENKEITMVNLSNVTHTCVCGTPNEHVSSTIASVVETDIDASIDVEGFYRGVTTTKHHTIRYQNK
jgi:hypothetical protein